jgi:hypothetical protein
LIKNDFKTVFYDFKKKKKKNLYFFIRVPSFGFYFAKFKKKIFFLKLHQIVC